MRIGLDFDNTIVDYDELFHKVAVEAGHIPADTERSKMAVRTRLRENGMEQTWIELQGYVYGARMKEATTYPGAIEFFHWAHDNGHTLSIVSHKTKHPFAGPTYDLHAAAREWTDLALAHGDSHIIERENIYFELTKPEKISRIASLDFDLFVDDLLEILVFDGFPSNTLPVLFDPTGTHDLPPNGECVKDWLALKALVERLQ